MAFEALANPFGLPIWATTLVVIWVLIWKGLALWKSAKLNQPVWFVVLLVVNTLGLLEILYLFFFSEMKFKKRNLTKKEKKISKKIRKLKPL